MGKMREFLAAKRAKVGGGRKERSEFEKAVWLGVNRALLDEEIKKMVGPEGGPGLWADPSAEMRAIRKSIAGFIVRDLEGLEEEPRDWKEAWFDEATGQWVNVDGKLFDTFRKEWEYYREKYGRKVSVEDVIKAFPFRPIRDKRARGHRTDIEALVEEELKRRGEEYQFEALLDFYHVDFFLPQRNLVIECDQEYWHRRREALGKDLSKTLYLREKGHRVARLMFGREIKYETVRRDLDELLEGDKACFKTVLTPRLRRFAVEWQQELQQKYGAGAASIEKLQRLLDEDKGVVASRQSVTQKVKGFFGL